MGPCFRADQRDQKILKNTQGSQVTRKLLGSFREASDNLAARGANPHGTFESRLWGIAHLGDIIRGGQRPLCSKTSLGRGGSQFRLGFPGLGYPRMGHWAPTGTYADCTQQQIGKEGLRDSIKRASFDPAAVAHLPKSSHSLETCGSAQAARPYDSHQTSNGPGRPGGGAGTRKCTRCANAATKGAHRQSVGLHLRVLLLLLATLCCCRPSFLGRSPLLLIFQHVLPTFRLLLRRPLRRHHLFHLRGMLF